MVAVDELERLRPTEGARFLLQLDGVDDEGARARYRAWVLTPDASFEYAAALGDDAAVEVRAVGVAAADALTTMLTTIARLTARAAAGKRTDGLPPWPPRVMRWRGPGR